MEILNKVEELSDEVIHKINSSKLKEIDNTALAKSIMRAGEKKEGINAILKENGSDYRISGIDVAMSLPPSISFEVSKIGEGSDD